MSIQSSMFFKSTTIAFVFAVSVPSYGVASDPLPQPLTLEAALSYALEHPLIELAKARLDKAQARLGLTEAEDDLNITFEGRLSAVEPSKYSLNRDNNDNKAILKASKRLYDFGYTDANEAAAQLQLKTQRQQYLGQEQKQILDVARKFFEVLIADKTYVLLDEEMTMAFLRYDKAKDRNELGTVSDLELLQLENTYREKLQLRKAAEQEQRLSRQRLASVLNRPEDLPSELLEPKVDWDKALPEIDKVTQNALKKNPELLAAIESIEASRQKLQAADASNYPVIRGEVMVADYNRKTGSTHPASASLVLEVPLYTGHRKQAETALARSEMIEKQAELKMLELSVRQTALELVLKLDTLQSDLKALQVSADYGELYLDKNRALYELEVASDYGDAVVRVSDVILKRLNSLLSYRLTEMQLAALQGELKLPGVDNEK